MLCMNQKKEITECKKIIIKLHKRASWLNAFSEAYHELEEQEKIFGGLSNHAMSAKMALVSQILIMSLAIFGSSKTRKDDYDFNKLKLFLKNRKITNYLCQSVVNKDLAKQVIRDFKKFKTPKCLKTLRDKHFAHITNKRFLKGRGRMIYEYQQKVSYFTEMLHRLIIAKS